MDTTEASGPSSPGTREKKYLTVRQAAFIGVGAMVGAGIFALLGAAGEVAGAAVWLSFLIAGFVAVLQGYSFAKLGARYPSAGGLLEYVAKATGNGHFTGVTAWLTYSANAIVTAMVAVSFGSYAASTFAEGNQVWIKVFAALIILVMTGVNIVGSSLVANAQTVIVYIVLGILSVFAVVTLVNMTPSLLAPSKYPPFTLGRAGYWLMTITALFATAGATNAGLYLAQGLSERLAARCLSRSCPRPIEELK